MSWNRLAWSGGGNCRYDRVRTSVAASGFFLVPSENLLGAADGSVRAEKLSCEDKNDYK